jgi:hypothetical protein
MRALPTITLVDLQAGKSSQSRIVARRRAPSVTKAPAAA